MFKLGALVGTVGILTGAAFHAGFKSAIPAPNSAGPSPTRIAITFTEAVLPPPISTFVLLQADSAPAMRLTVAARPKDRAVIEAVVPRPLAPGKYIVRWKNGAADDGHPSRGAFAFSVAAPQ